MQEILSVQEVMVEMEVQVIMVQQVAAISVQSNGVSLNNSGTSPEAEAEAAETLGSTSNTQNFGATSIQVLILNSEVGIRIGKTAYCLVHFMMVRHLQLDGNSNTTSLSQSMEQVQSIE